MVPSLRAPSSRQCGGRVPQQRVVKTAKPLGLSVPFALLGRADEIME
jgi:hypothetical protein